MVVTIGDKITDETLQTTSAEKQQKYQHRHQGNLISMNILKVKKYCLLIKV